MDVFKAHWVSKLEGRSSWVPVFLHTKLQALQTHVLRWGNGSLRPALLSGVPRSLTPSHFLEGRT